MMVMLKGALYSNNYILFIMVTLSNINVFFFSVKKRKINKYLDNEAKGYTIYEITVITIENISTGTHIDLYLSKYAQKEITSQTD